MSSTILFDRVIDVTFIRNTGAEHRTEHIITPLFSMTLTQGTTVHQRKIGDDGIVYTVVYMARGTTHSVPSMEELRKGYSKSGTPYSQGDIIRVMSEGTIWNVTEVVYRKKSSGRSASALRAPITSITDVTKTGFAVVSTAPNFTDVFSIRCPSSKRKPDMTFTVKQIPGQICFNATLSIRNLVLGSINIREWGTMIVRAGYRGGPSEMFQCPIFTSYIQTPNPDGVTVFEGLTTGAVTGVLNEKPVIATFESENPTVRMLLDAMGPALGTGVTVDNALPEKILDLRVPALKGTRMQYGNTLSMLNGIQEILSTLVRTLYPETMIVVQLIQASVKVYWLNGDDDLQAAQLAEHVVSLDAVKGCSFSGPVLTVKAAWNPQLNPGNIFYMPSSFYSGSKVPNNMPRATFIDKANLYRILTMDVAFGTVDNNNEMTITALPTMYMDNSALSGADKSLSSYDLEQVLQAQIEDEDTSVIHIRIGEAAGETFNSVVQSKTGNQLFDNNTNAYAKASAAGLNPQELVEDTTTVDTDNGALIRTCLSNIALYYYWYDPKGPKMDRKKKGKDGTCGRFFVELDELKKTLPEGVSLMQVYKQDGIPVWVIAVPLIALFTYWMHEQEKNNSVNPWDIVTPSTIGKIHGNGKKLMVPQFNAGYDGLKSLKDIFRDAYLTYKDDDNYSGWARECWYPVYYMLGGTEVL